MAYKFPDLVSLDEALTEDEIAGSAGRRFLVQHLRAGIENPARGGYELVLQEVFDGADGARKKETVDVESRDAGSVAVGDFWYTCGTRLEAEALVEDLMGKMSWNEELRVYEISDDPLVLEGLLPAVRSEVFLTEEEHGARFIDQVLYRSVPRISEGDMVDVVVATSDFEETVDFEQLAQEQAGHKRFGSIFAAVGFSFEETDAALAADEEKLVEVRAAIRQAARESKASAGKGKKSVRKKSVAG